MPGTLDTREITLDGNGRFLLTWNSPRTGKKTWARSVSIRPNATDVTVRLNGEANGMVVKFSTVEQRLVADGMVHQIHFTGTAAAVVEVAAHLAA